MSACLAETLLSEPGALAPAAEPRRIGRYCVLGVLGEGAMGVVYRAHDPELNRDVALKTLRWSLLQGAHGTAAAQRLRNEAQAAARLAHPGIVSVFEYGEDGDERFIAMEYVRGTPLLAGMAQPGALPVDDVLCLMVQLLAALQAAHDEGVWHRDIKPANLLVTPAGRLKVADFGIARIDAVALTHDASVMGSPGYMAPECYRCAGVDQRADVYAAGVLLYELLTGTRPFRGPPDIVMYKTLNLPPPVLARPDAPLTLSLTRFEHVVQKALAKSPDERWPSAQAMREALVLAAGRPVPNTLSAEAMQLLGAQGDSAGASASASASGASARSGHSLPRAARVPTTPPVEPTPPPAPAPSVVAASAAQRFDAALLDGLAALLSDDLGPLARCVVQRAAVRSADANPRALSMRVANDALAPAQRAAFIERARALLPQEMQPAAAAAPPSGLALPLLGESTLEPRLVAEAQALLTRRMGPIAAWLTRRAADGARSREQFIARLADLAAEGRERERLAAALCRLR